MTDDPLYVVEDGDTALTPEEQEGLIPTYITTRGELNEAEQRNIAAGAIWASRRRREVLDEAFLRTLHKRMFGDVWRWAGAYRTTAKNIGVDAWKIATDLQGLLGDARYWVEHDTYPADEIAARFHHRLVLIHPFPNGNGRHSRLAADLLAVQLGRDRLTWGRANLTNAGDMRECYIAALRAADHHDIGPLLEFVRS
jgi:Fic-DOC domain mobile mystery protein B